MGEDHPADLARVRRDLVAATESLRFLFAHHPDGVFSLDLDGRFTSVNPAAEILSGYAEDEMLGMSFLDLVPDQEAVTITVGVFEQLLGRTAQEFHARFREKSGAIAELEIVGLPIIVDDEVVGIYGIAKNVTERRRLQEQVEEARRAAEAANEAKSVFLANMSHEIRTPLSSVLAAAELLGESDLDATQRRLVAAMDRAGARLLRLISQILDLSRLESGHADVVWVPLSVRAVVDHLVAGVGPRVREKGLSLDASVDAAVPEALVGDPMFVAQVLDNLVDNAVKFTAAGAITVRVDRVPASDASTRVRFVVSDTGIGLTGDQQQTIFDSFSQADPSITREHGGTGLGLAIVRSLVLQLGGTISVESAVGVGSAFTVELPFEPAT